MTLALYIYRRLARAFPHEFKLAYGTEVLHEGEEVMTEAAGRHGIGGLVRIIADITVRLAVEYLSEIRRDLRYGLRALIKSPGFALVGIVSLGIGIGLTTYVYTAKVQLLFRGLPGAENADRLVIPEKSLSYYDVEQYREEKKLFSGVAAFQPGVPFNVSFSNDANSKPHRIFGQLVSTDYFAVLGIHAQLGRVLSPEFDKIGDAPVVVISDRFWRTRLNSSPDAVGQTLRLNGQPATIVGITPKDFHGAASINPAELFVPVTVPSTLAPELGNDALHNHSARDFLALICLAPGVTIDAAEAAVDGIQRRIDQQDQFLSANIDKSRRVSLFTGGTMVPLPRNLKGPLVAFFAVLMALIMAIACMNLANMLLARGANRRKELAIRLAIGASRFRLIRQMITEGVLLSLLGGIAGFALAYGLSIVAAKVNTQRALPAEGPATPDWNIALLVFCLAILCGIGFTLVPALRATRVDVTPALKDGRELRLPGFRRFGLRNLLMVAQVAGSLTLLLLTGFLVVGISEVSSFKTMVDPHTVYLFSLDPVRDGCTPEKSQSLFDKLPAELMNTGRVSSVAMAAQAPFAKIDEDDPGQWTTENTSGKRVQVSAVAETVGAGYFAALGEHMMAGREFTDLEQRSPGGESKTLPAVVNESAAVALFGNANGIGRIIRNERQSYEVVGVIRNWSTGIAGTRSVIYLPLTRRNFARPPADGITIMLRSDAGADALNAARATIASIDPRLTVFNTRSLQDHLERMRASEQFAVDTYGAIGVFGLVLAAIGLAGVTAYAVVQRRKEIGIRMALGASKGQVLRLVLREGMALVIVGAVLGFAAAFGLSKMLATLTSFFVEALKIGTTDPRLLIGAPLLLTALALLACYVPSRSATKIDPLRALRQE